MSAGRAQRGSIDCDEAERLVDAAERARGTVGKGTRKQLAVLGNLGRGLLWRYQCRGDGNDLERAIVYLRQVWRETPPGAPERSMASADLALCLHSRYHLDGQRYARDAAEAVALQEEVVGLLPAGHPALAAALFMLAQYRYTRFLSSGRPKDLDEVIDLYEHSLASARDGSRDAAYATAALVAMLSARYCLGDSGERDLDRAQAMFERLEVSGGLAGDDVTAAGMRSNLAQALFQAYQRSGRQELLDRSTALQASAPATTPPFQAQASNNEALTLMARYYRTGRLEDLDAAIAAQEAALAASPSGAPSTVGLLGNLSSCFQRRYEATDDPTDLDRSIDAARRAAAVAGPAPGDTVLHRLGASLLARHELEGQRQPGDLDDAIELLRQAARTVPSGSYAAPVYLSTLGDALVNRYGGTGRPADLAEGVELLQAAVEVIGEDSPVRATLQHSLACALAFEARRTGRPGDRHRAVEAFRRACRYGLDGATSVVLEAVQSWGAWAMTRMAWAEAGEAYGYGLEALQRIARVQLLRRSKEVQLRRTQGMAARAAYALARSGATPQAAVALETGRALMLSEALERDQADLEKLRPMGHADVYERYRRAAAAVSELERQQYVAAEGTAGQEASTGALRAARAELDTAISSIRAVPGYERFLQPATFEDIVAAASFGPVVYLASCELGGLAIVVGTSSPVPTVRWLPDLTLAALRQRAGAYLRAAAGSGGEWQAVLERTLDWLWDAVMGPVLEPLRPAALAATLVPTGMLGLLPLHAARTRDPSTTTGWRYALDQLPLAYAPNAVALAAAQRTAERRDVGTLLAVQEPLPVQASALPACASEVAAIRAHFDGSEILRHQHATRLAVLSKLASHPVCHFACHGRADPAAPLDSALLMADDEPLTLRDILAGSLATGPRLVVLSACDTAMPDQDLPDEVVSFPTSLLQAGAGGVIGSLWKVPDESAMALMARFYQLWRRNGLTPPEALRQAQRWLRDSTNGEKQSAFPYLPELSPRQSLTGAARTLWGGARSHEHPSQWAGFIYVGV